VNSVETVEEDKSEGAVTQLQKALASCMKEMAEMRKAFGTARGPPSQPNATMQRGNRPPFNQARGCRQPTATSDHVRQTCKVPVDIEEWDLISRPT